MASFPADFFSRPAQSRPMTIHQPGGHLDQMLRQTRIHHVQLSSMADLKANMLLTLCSIMITFAAPHVVSPRLRWPALTLTLFCLTTIALAIYTVMPKVRANGRPEEKSATRDNPAFNILFFGDFVRMPYGEFEATMETVLNDTSQVYEAQVREIYTLGAFLAAKKYRFLRMAYVAFLFGMLASTGVLVVGLVV
jgi:hypothetical protein